MNEEVLEPVFPTAAADDFILPPPPPHCTHAALPTALPSLSGYFAMQISFLCTISRERKKKTKTEDSLLEICDISLTRCLPLSRKHCRQTPSIPDLVSNKLLLTT